LRLVRKVRRFRDEIVRYETYEVSDADMIVVAYGSVSRTALSAVREARSKGLKVGFFRPVTLWPFPDKELQALVNNVKAVLVPELNCGQMVLEVERVVSEGQKFLRRAWSTASSSGHRKSLNLSRRLPKMPSQEVLDWLRARFFPHIWCPVVVMAL